MIQYLKKMLGENNHHHITLLSLRPSNITYADYRTKAKMMYLKKFEFIYQGQQVQR